MLERSAICPTKWVYDGQAVGEITRTQRVGQAGSLSDNNKLALRYVRGMKRLFRPFLAKCEETTLRDLFRHRIARVRSGLNKIFPDALIAQPGKRRALDCVFGVKDIHPSHFACRHRPQGTKQVGHRISEMFVVIGNPKCVADNRVAFLFCQIHAENCGEFDIVRAPFCDAALHDPVLDLPIVRVDVKIALEDIDASIVPSVIPLQAHEERVIVLR
jgi:hypothetical protein